MALPTRSDVQTLDFSGYGQPSAYLEAKNVSSGTLDYSLFAQPVWGLSSGADLNLLNEPVTASEALEALFTARAERAETATGADAFSPSLVISLVRDESGIASAETAVSAILSLGLNESIGGAFGLLSLADYRAEALAALAASDLNEAALASQNALAEAVNGETEISPSLQIFVAQTEAVSAEYGNVPSLGLSCDLGEGLATSAAEGLSGSLSLRLSLLEQASGGDALTSRLSAVDALVEQFAANDAVNGGVTITLALADSAEAGDFFKFLYGPEGWFAPTANGENWQNPFAASQSWVVGRPGGEPGSEAGWSQAELGASDPWTVKPATVNKWSN